MEKVLYDESDEELDHANRLMKQAISFMMEAFPNLKT